MIAPSALPLLSIGVAVLMAATSLSWASHLAATAWMVLVRRRLGVWLIVIVAGVALACFGVLRLALGAGPAAATTVLTIWLVPFVASPALNLIARVRSEGLPTPVPEKGGTMSWRTFVFDTERARLRDAYEPPPLAEDV